MAPTAVADDHASGPAGWQMSPLGPRSNRKQLPMTSGSLAQRRGPRLSRGRFRRYLWGYFFVSPWIIGTLIFTAYPLIYSLYLAVVKYDLITEPEFVAFGNFTRMFADDIFYTALANTAFYTFLAVTAQLLVAFFMAVLLNQKVPLVNVFR
ncbi:MAG: sugar ABC transporter permease, partial [Armatimonadetes bacterium]|nr:sugar ABC transporter permease [Armatimonadota bacterium]